MHFVHSQSTSQYHSLWTLRAISSVLLFQKKKEKKARQSEYPNGEMQRGKKSCNRQSLAEPTAFYCEIESTVGYKVTSFNSQYVTFLSARTRFRGNDLITYNWIINSMHTATAGWNHFSTMPGIDIDARNWIFLREGRTRNIHRWKAGDKVANSLFRWLMLNSIFFIYKFRFKEQLKARK